MDGEQGNQDGQGGYNIDAQEVANLTSHIYDLCGKDSVKTYFVLSAMHGMAAAVINVDPLLYMKNTLQSREIGSQLAQQFTTNTPPLDATPADEDDVFN